MNRHLHHPTNKLERKLIEAKLKSKRSRRPKKEENNDLGDIIETIKPSDIDGHSDSPPLRDVSN